MFSWIKKIRDYDEIIEDNYRLKKIIGTDSFRFFWSGSRAEFIKKQIYWINCMDNYKHDVICTNSAVDDKS